MDNIIGITSVGCYVPYYYMERSSIGKAWGIKGQKGQKSMGNSDEDSITMAVEAAYECFRYVSREQIDALYFASTTAPYHEKTHSTLIATVCNLGEDVFVTDFAHSLRSSTMALHAAYSEVLSQSSRQVLVTAADMRNGYPKSVQEQLFGDAAAAITIGSDKVIAAIDHFSSVNNEIVDVWRNREDVYVRNAEARFALEEGYLDSMEKAIEAILNKSKIKAHEFKKVILSSAGFKDHMKLMKKFGFTNEQIQNNFVLEIGACGTAQPILMLVDAIENSNPGDKILLASYGNGADAIIFTVTDNIKKLNTAKSVNKYLENRKEFSDYGRFLSFRGIIEANPGEDYKIPASTAMTWREQGTYLKLNASKCKSCGNEIFPVNRICPNCRSKDDFEVINKTEEITKMFTYSIDNLAGRSDDPIIVQSVAEDKQGARFYMNMTDFDTEHVEIDMELEFTFRKIHNLGNFVNYYWKLKPLRRKLVK